MLTYAAIKFICEPGYVYVIRAKDHLEFRQRFFVDKLTCNARWKCKKNCNGIEQHNDDDDMRSAEVLLMGNSLRNIITNVEQCYPDLFVIKPEVLSTAKPDKSNRSNERKRKRGDLKKFKSPRHCKKLKSKQECEKENDQLNEKPSCADEFGTGFSWKDYNGNIITISPVDAYQSRFSI